MNCYGFPKGRKNSKTYSFFFLRQLQFSTVQLILQFEILLECSACLISVQCVGSDVGIKA